VKDAVDCRWFEEQLDAGIARDLTDEAVARLWDHAAACPPCRALLGLRTHVPGPSLAELEGRVPDAWVDEMEPSVRRALAQPTAPEGHPRSLKVPLLAAALVALLLSTGISRRELSRSRERANALAVQLLDQQRRLVQLENPSATSMSRVPRFSPRESWLRTIEDRPAVTVEELREWLAQLPDDFTLLGPQRTRELGGARWVPAPWREAFEALPDDAGATAADLRNVLDRIGLPEGASVPTRRLLDLLG